ncbi:MAG: hypothetical protein WCO56_04850 [Verrucomicrobiota bacterium]
MGILNFFSKAKPELLQLPSGSFTVDPQGRVVSSTLPHNFPEEQTRHIAGVVLQAFKQAQAANVPLLELAIEFSALKITAKEMRGGAMIFLAPHGPSTQG